MTPHATPDLSVVLARRRVMTNNRLQRPAMQITATSMVNSGPFREIIMSDTMRSAFLMPRDICYLNTAYMGPRLKAVDEAARRGVDKSNAPWTITSQDFFTDVEKARTLFAQMIGSPERNIALVPSASYGIETAARNLNISAGEAILTLEGQFPSNIYPWQRLANANGAEVRHVKEPEDGDWTQAVLEQMNDNIAIAALPHCHWTNGATLDLPAISGACAAHGTALVLDVTQSLGAMPFSLKGVHPDFLVCASYKWMLGPYSLGFLYVSDDHLDGNPLEENWVNRKGSEDFSQLVNYQDAYQDGARRFDFGERSNPILLPMVIAAMEQLLSWKVETIAAHLKTINCQIAERAAQYGFQPTAEAIAAPHMIGLRHEKGLSPNLADRLKAHNVHVSVRGQSIRVSPHLHIDEQDINMFISALAE